MADSTQNAFSEEEKVRILLHEYATLRSEILTRSQNVFQLIVAGTALFIWLIGRPADFWFWFALAISVTVIGVFSWLIYRDIDKAARRLRELESDINRRAGENLLVWETRWGGAVAGYWGPSNPLPAKDSQATPAEPPRSDTARGSGFEGGYEQRKGNEGKITDDSQATPVEPPKSGQGWKWKARTEGRESYCEGHYADGTYDKSGNRVAKVAANPHFSVTAPSQMAPGQTCVVNVWAHLGHQIEEIVGRAKRVDENAVLAGTKGPVKVARGALLAVRLEIDSLVIEKPNDSLLWEGEIANAMFAVSVPKAIAHGPRRGVVSVSAEGLEIARLYFHIVISQEPGEPRLLPARALRHETAFASYSHEDRDAVLARIQGMKKVAPDLEVFLDAISLRSGEHWQDRLIEEIAKRDVFYLFWSLAASKSEWVEREWRSALATDKGLESINPVPIERKPPRPDPPKELASLHFDDPELYFMSNG